MPSLKDLVTNLSNFRYYSGVGTFTANKTPYGNDLPDGQKSSQPYVIGKEGDVDILGTGAILKDVKRISKFLLDKSHGLNFTVKQVGLQLMNAQTEHKTTRKVNRLVDENGGINFLKNEINRIINDVGPTRIYNPLNVNLLAQVAGSALGAHINRHGLTIEMAEDDKYKNIVTLNNLNGNNRLVKLAAQMGNSLLTNASAEIISSYRGGPNSFLGIGNTTVHRADGLNTFTPFVSGLKSNILNGFVPISYSDISSINSQGKLDNSAVDGNGLRYNTTKVFDFMNNDFRAYKKLQNPKAFTDNRNYSDLTVDEEILGNSTDVRITDYSVHNKYKRIGVINSNADRFKLNRHDGVNMVGLYHGKGAIGLSKNLFDINGAEVTGANIRDLIKFRIKSLNNDNPDDGVFMIFRAFFNGAITDSIDANWKPYTYAGRGESFYGYEGTVSNMSFSFTIVAFSKAEMKPLYQKLNYLKSTMFADYKANRMRGNISEITIGDYLKYQPGIITSMTITIPEDANWEIAMNELDKTKENYDKDMHELPMMLKVEINFVPIYNFLPRKSADAAFIGIDDELESRVVNSNSTINISKTNINRKNSPKEWAFGNDAKLK